MVVVVTEAACVYTFITSFLNHQCHRNGKDSLTVEVVVVVDAASSVYAIIMKHKSTAQDELSGILYQHHQ